jgi:hypothetical protein
METAHIKDLLIYLRVTEIPKDVAFWTRILFLDGVGPVSAERHGQLSIMLTDMELEPPSKSVEDLLPEGHEDEFLTLSTIHSAITQHLRPRHRHHPRPSLPLPRRHPQPVCRGICGGVGRPAGLTEKFHAPWKFACISENKSGYLAQYHLICSYYTQLHP